VQKSSISTRRRNTAVTGRSAGGRGGRTGGFGHQLRESPGVAVKERKKRGKHGGPIICPLLQDPSSPSEAILPTRASGKVRMNFC